MAKPEKIVDSAHYLRYSKQTKVLITKFKFNFKNMFDDPKIVTPEVTEPVEPEVVEPTEPEVPQTPETPAAM